MAVKVANKALKPRREILKKKHYNMLKKKKKPVKKNIYKASILIWSSFLICILCLLVCTCAKRTRMMRLSDSNRGLKFENQHIAQKFGFDNFFNCKAILCTSNDDIEKASHDYVSGVMECIDIKLEERIDAMMDDLSGKSGLSKEQVRSKFADMVNTSDNNTKIQNSSKGLKDDMEIFKSQTGTRMRIVKDEYDRMIKMSKEELCKALGP